MGFQKYYPQNENPYVGVVGLERRRSQLDMILCFVWLWLHATALVDLICYNSIAVKPTTVEMAMPHIRKLVLSLVFSNYSDLSLIWYSWVSGEIDREREGEYERTRFGEVL
jgi:hypothetical protein